MGISREETRPMLVQGRGCPVSMVRILTFRAG